MDESGQEVDESRTRKRRAGVMSNKTLTILAVVVVVLAVVAIAFSRKINERKQADQETCVKVYVAQVTPDDADVVLEAASYGIESHNGVLRRASRVAQETDGARGLDDMAAACGIQARY